MAFDEVTLFEFDLEGAQFGPREMDVPDRFKGSVDTGSAAADESADVEADVEVEDDSGGPSVGRMILMALVVTVVATLIVRRLRGGDEAEESTTIEFDEDDGEAPEIGA